MIIIFIIMISKCLLSKLQLAGVHPLTGRQNILWGQGDEAAPGSAETVRRINSLAAALGNDCVDDKEEYLEPNYYTLKLH